MGRNAIAEEDEFHPPRAQRINKFLGQQIRIEINKEQVKPKELKPYHQDSMSLLFYDFN